MKVEVMDLPLFVQWLENKKVLSESTIFVYTKSIERFLVRNPDLENIEEYNNFLIELTKKKRSMHYYSALKAFIDFKFQSDANTRKALIDNLVRPTERHDTIHIRKYLKMEDLLNVINALESPKHKVLALIQAYTGVRVGDILRLKRGSILFEEYKDKPAVKMVIIGKGKKANIIYITNQILQDEIVEYITTYFNHADYYFIELGKMKGRHGNINNEFLLTKMNYQWFWADLKQALYTVGIDKKDFATHDFRRCFARRAWEKYKDIHVLQGLLNHRDPKVTLKYLDQSGLKNADYHYEMQQE